MRLSPDSDRSAGARRFGLELRRAIKARGGSIRGLARDEGINRGRIANWACGSSLPSVETAQRLADILMWPSLAELSRKAREKACDNCGRVFTVETPSPQRYCSLECRRFKNAKVTGSRDLSRAVLERRARRYTAAVDAMCRACEPSGVCRTPSCPLQVAGVSPHAVAREAIA